MGSSVFTTINGRAYSNSEPLQTAFTVTRMQRFRKTITNTLILIFLWAYLANCDFFQLSFLSENTKPILHGKIGGSEISYM